MKTDKEILDEFGKVLVSNVFNFNFRILKKNLIRNLKAGTLEEKIDHITKESYENALFEFLKIFEENEEFKLIYEKNGKQVNLVEISEMLKAEIHGENGWIARFSNELNHEDLL